MRYLPFVTALFIAVALFGSSARADQIGVAGTLTVSQDSNISTECGGASPCAQFVFSGGSVLNTNPGGDSAAGTPVSISATTGNFTMVNTSGSFFNPTGTIIVGNSTSGVLDGGVSFVDISSNNSGSFNVDIGVTAASFTGCSALGCTNSNILSEIAAANGTGLLTFQFSGNPGAMNLTELLNATNLVTTYSGSISPVPEPASLTLLGTGLFGAGITLRRKLRK